MILDQRLPDCQFPYKTAAVRGLIETTPSPLALFTWVKMFLALERLQNHLCVTRCHYRLDKESRKQLVLMLLFKSFLMLLFYLFQVWRLMLSWTLSSLDYSRSYLWFHLSWFPSDSWGGTRKGFCGKTVQQQNKSQYWIWLYFVCWDWCSLATGVSKPQPGSQM